MNTQNHSKKLGWKQDGNCFWNSVEDNRTDSGMSNKLTITVQNYSGTKKEYNELLDRLQIFLKAEKV